MSEPASISTSATATGTAPLHGITVANCGKNCGLGYKPIKKKYKKSLFYRRKIFRPTSYSSGNS